MAFATSRAAILPASAGPRRSTSRRLAETLASWAGYLAVDRERFHVVGQEINANHIKSIRKGYVYGRVTPIHIGRSTHVWETRITDEENRLICISKLTVAILDR